MLVSLTGACGLRIVWIFTVFQVYPTTKILYLSYPVSWLITALVHAVCYLIIKRKFSVKTLKQRNTQQKNRLTVNFLSGGFFDWMGMFLFLCLFLLF